MNARVYHEETANMDVTETGEFIARFWIGYWQATLLGENRRRQLRISDCAYKHGRRRRA